MVQVAAVGCDVAFASGGLNADVAWAAVVVASLEIAQLDVVVAVGDADVGAAAEPDGLEIDSGQSNVAFLVAD